MLTFKALSVLLDYPTATTVAALPEIPAVLAEENLLSGPALQSLLDFVQELRGTELLAMQENYVELFDRGRKLSLHIFEHTHGESRDRGPAMIALMDQYRESGLELDARELPDFLPLVLEYASLQPLQESSLLLGEAMPVLTLIGERLRERRSSYATVFDALEAIAGEAENADDLRKQVAEEGPDEALVNIDKVWEEEAITFTEGSALSGSHTAGTTVTSPADPAMGEPLRWVDPGPGAQTASG